MSGPRSSSRMKKAAGFYLLFSAVALAVIFIPVTILRGTDLNEDKHDVAEGDKIQLEIRQANNELLIKMSTLLFGGLGALLFKGYLEKGRKLPRPQRARAVVAAVLAGASIYFGYLSQDVTLWMLGASFFNLAHPILTTPTQLQFFAFLGAIAVLSDFTFHAIEAD